MDREWIEMCALRSRHARSRIAWNAMRGEAWRASSRGRDESSSTSSGWNARWERERERGGGEREGSIADRERSQLEAERPVAELNGKNLAKIPFGPPGWFELARMRFLRCDAFCWTYASLTCLSYDEKCYRTLSPQEQYVLSGCVVHIVVHQLLRRPGLILPLRQLLRVVLSVRQFHGDTPGQWTSRDDEHVQRRSATPLSPVCAAFLWFHQREADSHLRDPDQCLYGRKHVEEYSRKLLPGSSNPISAIDHEQTHYPPATSSRPWFASRIIEDEELLTNLRRHVDTIPLCISGSISRGSSRENGRRSAFSSLRVNNLAERIADNRKSEFDSQHRTDTKPIDFHDRNMLGLSLLTYKSKWIKEEIRFSWLGIRH